MTFYTFWQNNSGGEYDSNGNVEELVIVEADTAADANEFAESVGVYFNGVDKDIDCDCCGDRWSPVEDENGRDVPTYCERPLTKFTSKRMRSTSAVVYYKNGRKVYGKKPRREWREEIGAYEWSN